MPNSPSEGFWIEPFPGGGTGGTGGGGAAISAAGASASNGTVVFSNSNNVSFGMAGSTVTATASFAQSVQPVAASAANGSVAFGSLSFSNINGVSFVTAAGPAIQASVVTTYLTSQSNQAASASNGVFTFQTVGFSNANNVTFGTSAGSIITASVAATVAQSVQPVAASASNGSFLFSTVAFSNANGVTFGTSAGSIISASVVTTYLTSQSNQAASASNGSFTFQTVAFSNANNVTFGTSAGSIITASVAATVAQSNQQATLFATGNTTQSSSGTTNASSVIFRGSGAASVGITNGSILIDVAAGAAAITQSIGMSTQTAGGSTAGTTGYATGDDILYHFVPGSNITMSQSIDAASGTLSIYGVAGAITHSTYEPYPMVGLNFNSIPLQTATSGIVSIFPFVVAPHVSAGCMNLNATMTFLTVGTSSGRQTAGFRYALYTRGTGTNSTTMGTIVSSAVEWSITGNNSTYSISQITATSYSGFGAALQTSSAGVNITSQYTGNKLFALPMNTLLTPGNYWLGIMGSKSTSSVNVGITISFRCGGLDNQGTGLAPMGSLSTAYSLGADPFGGRWNVGAGSWTSAGSVTNVPVSIAFTSITAMAVTDNTGQPLIRFWST